MTQTFQDGHATQLCAYTDDVLTQMSTVMQAHLHRFDNAYAQHLGAHMRHIIEHYDTLAQALRVSDPSSGHPLVVDYDARARDLTVETDPAVALGRVRKVGQVLTALNLAALTRAVEVHTRGGLRGEHNFKTLSSVAREIMFLNSHATHHFAVLQAYAHQRGETLGDGVGKAPATVAHELAEQACAATS